MPGGCRGRHGDVGAIPVCRRKGTDGPKGGIGRIELTRHHRSAVNLGTGSQRPRIDTPNAMNRKPTIVGKTLRSWKLLVITTLAIAGGVAARAQQTNNASQMEFSNFQVISERNIFNPNRTGRHKRGNRPQPVADRSE